MQLSLEARRYGVMAVYGRPILYAHEIRHANYCENVRSYFHERSKHPNWAAWTSQNPSKAAVLNAVESATDD